MSKNIIQLNEEVVKNELKEIIQQLKSHEDILKKLESHDHKLKELEERINQLGR